MGIPYVKPIPFPFPKFVFAFFFCFVEILSPTFVAQTIIVMRLIRTYSQTSDRPIGAGTRGMF